ncbi:MAG: restriction endonuclease subunit S [Vulcanibacillus sp.]
MNNWNKCTLGDVAKYSNTRVSINKLSVKNYISTENMLPNRGGIGLASSVPNGNAVKYYKGQTLISNIRPYFKKIWHANNDGGCSADVLVFETNDEIDDKYFFYYLSQDHFFEYVMAGSKGTKMPRGDKQLILKYPFSYPCKKEQQAIAATLSCLDDKIELNNKINKTLEEMAQAIFKSWFVDFEPFQDGEFEDSELGRIPKGWRVFDLGEVIKEIKEKVKDLDLPVLSAVKTGNLILSEEYFTKQVFSKNISKYIVVKPFEFAYNPARINIGSIGMNELDYVCCVSPVYVAFKSESRYKWFIKMLIKTERFKAEFITRASGSVRQTISFTELSKIKIVYPTNEVVDRFNLVFENLYKTQFEILQETNTLNEVGETLLPKLMSGEIRVPIEEIQSDQ